ncbi:MAG TPA: histidine kinase [Acidimicrobiales bacterium]|nr:histidine kinase [Acidimicrobiales bacterium]
MSATWWILIAAVAGAAAGTAAVVRYVIRGSDRLVTDAQRTSFQALRTANLAAPHLRSGLGAEHAGRAAPHLRALLGTPAVAIAAGTGVVGADGVDAEHAALLGPVVAAALAGDGPQVVGPDALACAAGGACPLQAGVVVPLRVDTKVVGALAALDSSAPAGLLRLSAEVGEFVSTQLALAELDRSKERATRAELRFLRAQISPHFVYNALTAIESYVRSDPDRARELLVAFADFTRYSFAPFRQTTTIADELRLVDLYLDLARARFGDRFSVQLRVAPEVLSVRVPSLILQPVVENALRHGLEPNGHGTLSISVEDADAEAVLSVDDDGVGVEPARMRHLLDGTSGEEGVGLHNVDERLRAVFGEGHGLVVETGKGAGTRVTMRIPKSSTGVRVA